MTIVYPSPTPSHIPVWAAYEGGYFKRAGLDVKMQYVRPSVTAAAALLSGKVQFASLPATAPVLADVHGGDEVAVMTLVNRLVMSVVVQPGVQSFADLKGKTIGISKVGSSDDFWMRYVLKLKGLTPDRDVKLLSVGSTEAGLAALRAGEIAAYATGVPQDLEAQQNGDRILFRIGSLGIPYSTADLVTTRRYAAADPQVVTHVIQAIAQGAHRFQTDRAFAQQVMKKYLHNANAAQLDDVYSTYAPLFEQVPMPSAAGIASVIKEYQAAGRMPANVDVATVVDPSFVQSLASRGFFKKVYSG